MRPSLLRRAIALALSAGARPPSGFGISGQPQKVGCALPAKTIDSVLHHERIERGRRRVHPIPGPLAALPDGAMVVAAGSAFTLLYAGQAHRWTNEGYAPPERLHHADGLLTPPSTLMALGSGYRPVLHPSINPTSDWPHHLRSV